MGLPGSGKTTLAKHLVEELVRSGISVSWLNADSVRKSYNDWDFSTEGRIRQAIRLDKLANESTGDVVLVDFIAALEQQRIQFNADFTIWMNTITAGRFADTNAAYETPDKYDIQVTSWESIDVKQIVDTINGSI